MNSYILETHLHTKESSSCSEVNASRALELYKSQGYSGLVITDHYCYEFFGNLGDVEWVQKVDSFLSGYHCAKETSKMFDIDVWLGMEIRFTENQNDYLVFGITRDFLIQYPEIYNVGIKRFKEMFSSELCIFQAHPFRKGMKVVDPILVDGYEGFNGNSCHDSNDLQAIKYSVKNKKSIISGSDFHRLDDLAKGGVILPNRPKDNSNLINNLREIKRTELILPSKFKKCLNEISIN